MGRTPEQAAALATQVRPHPRQLAWQELEFNAFLHFGMNTFTDREWGDGRESPSWFAPTGFEPDQWMAALASAGVRGVILTCKHHDGFCLWPTATTGHSVASSPWKGGRGDAVREVAEAAARAGLKFGVYLSPWDRNHPTYGAPEYNDAFVAQLTELLTGYGELFCVWFDGACGEGPNGKVTRYDWDRWYEAIRRHQPGAVIAVCGPDVRWCGNEAGHCRASEWSVVPAELQDNERTQKLSQQVDAVEFRTRIPSRQEDLGSRDVLAEFERYVWFPAEVNTSIRPGWFYHAVEDDQVKSVDELETLYDQSVGGNAALLLNVPPGPDGRLAAPDVAALAALGERLRTRFGPDLSAAASRTETPDGVEFAWAVPMTVSAAELREELTEGQRVEAFRLEYRAQGGWTTGFEGTVIGAKKLARWEPVATTGLRLVYERTRAAPALRSMRVYGPGPDFGHILGS